MEINLILKMLLVAVFVHRGDGLNSDEEDSRESLTSTTEVTLYDDAKSYRSPRAYRRRYDEHEEMTTVAMEQTEVMAKGGGGEPWGGYYDFLINEGSYKFWAVFQLSTAALLIYSGFAALYYAKINPPSADDFDDDFLRRRRRSTPPLFPLNAETFQRIMDALEPAN